MKIYFHRDFLNTMPMIRLPNPAGWIPPWPFLRTNTPFTNRARLLKKRSCSSTPPATGAVSPKTTAPPHRPPGGGSSAGGGRNRRRREHAFALCRPPGHHASSDSCWGFCYFNNIAVAVSSLLDRGLISSALIVDFDLHFGDGTANIFRRNEAVTFWHCRESSSMLFLDALENDLALYEADIVAVSAGFDRGVDDWGGMLSRKDYRRIGSLLAGFARQKCGGRLFATLEGGYNPQALARNIEAFLQGLEEA